jgi:hypothetical protein
MSFGLYTCLIILYAVGFLNLYRQIQGSITVFYLNAILSSFYLIYHMHEELRL